MTDRTEPDTPQVRSTWSRSGRPLARRLVRPLQSFLRLEQSGALILLGAAVIALAWANSPWWESYERVWHTRLTIRLGSLVIAQDLRHWINDGLMSLFFLLVGLEIKREVTVGELRDPRRLFLPAIAAVGGMVVPALVYLAFAADGATARGWGVPMATDVAFALGVLTLAARGAAPGLKPFLLTLAIVDDIGAILVIALFYSAGIDPLWSLAALGLATAIVALRRVHVRWTPAYVALGVGLWLAVFESGVHATIAGVALGLLTPAEPFQRPRAVSDEARRVADLTVDDPSPPDADAEHWLSLSRLSREAVSPLARLEEGLHPWTSFFVVPLFALANAGVHLGGELVGGAAARSVVFGIVAGLVLGKLVGVAGATLAARRWGPGELPEGVGPRDVLGLGAVAGVGFTVALFVADLAFADPELLRAAKVAILIASVVAGVVGSVLLRWAGRSAAAA